MVATIANTFQTLKIGKAGFAFLIVVTNALYGLAEAYLNILFPGNPLTAPTVIAVDAISNGLIVYLTVKETSAPA